MRPTLAGPFALLCAAGGWLTADLGGLRYDGGRHRDEILVRAMLVLLTPVVASFVGRWVAPKGQPSVSRFVFVPLAGGALNGAMIGLLAEFPIGGFGGAIVGPFVAAGFLPFLAPAFAAARSSRGRPGSLLATVERRSVWGASFAGIALGTLVPRFLGHRQAGSWAPYAEIALAGAALVGAMIVASLDVRDLARLSALASRALERRTKRPAAETIDLGVGAGASEEELAPAAGYREGGHVRAFVGDPAHVRGAVVHQLAIDALVLAATVAAVVVTTLAPARNVWVAL